MTTERVTITLEVDVLAYARKRAEADGLSLSAWLNRVADRDRRLIHGRAAMEEIWREVGPPTPEEDVWAQKLRMAELRGADQETLDRIWAEYPGRRPRDNESGASDVRL